MRIVVNDIAASSGGAMTILKQFYNFIKYNDSDNEWFFLLGDKYVEETKNIHVMCFQEVKNNHIKKLLFDCFIGKKIIDNINPDVVVSLQNVVVFGVHKPQILYIHQSIPFQTVKNFSFFKRNERSMAVVQYIVGAFIKLSINKADKIFVQTKWMKQAIEESFKQKTLFIYNVLPSIPKYEVDNSKFLSNRFFYPTSLSVYKNNGLIIDACNLLVEEGVNNFEVHLTLQQGTIRHNNIKCVGYLDSLGMQNEYQTSTLIFPSYTETCGLPLLEARSCQTMILASDMPYCHECLENYENSYFFDINNPKKLAKYMKMIIERKLNLNECEKKSLEKYNSWETMYNEIISTSVGDII